MSKKVKTSTYINLINDIKESQRVREGEIIYERDNVKISPEGIQLTTGAVWDWKIEFPQTHEYNKVLYEAIHARVCVGIPHFDNNNATYEFNAIDLMEYCASEYTHNIHKVGYHISFWSGVVIATICSLIIKFMF